MTNLQRLAFLLLCIVMAAWAGFDPVSLIRL